MGGTPGFKETEKIIVKKPEEVTSDLQGFFSKYVATLNPNQKRSFEEYLRGTEVKAAIDRAIQSRDTLTDTRYRLGCKIADDVLAKDNPELALRVLIKVHRDRFGEGVFNKIDTVTLQATLKSEGWNKATSLLRSIALQYSEKAEAELPMQKLSLRTPEGELITVKSQNDLPHLYIGLVNYYKQKQQLDQRYGSKAEEIAGAFLFGENVTISVTTKDGKTRELTVGDIESGYWNTIAKKVLDPKTIITWAE